MKLIPTLAASLAIASFAHAEDVITTTTDAAATTVGTTVDAAADVTTTTTGAAVNVANAAMTPVAGTVSTFTPGSMIAVTTEEAAEPVEYQIALTT